MVQNQSQGNFAVCNKSCDSFSKNPALQPNFVHMNESLGFFSLEWELFIK